MPDKHGNFKGILVRRIPWLEEEEALDELERDKDAEAGLEIGPACRGEGVARVPHDGDEWPYDDDPPDPL